MSSFRVLNLRYLGRQPLRAFLAVVAIAAAAAMTVASVVLVASLDRSIEGLLKNVSGPAAVRVTGPLTHGGVDPALVRVVEDTPGVEAAVPVVHAVTVAKKPGGPDIYMLALGFDCQIEALVGSFGCDEQSLNAPTDGPVAVSTKLSNLLGADGVIRTDAERVHVGDAIRNDALDDINDGRVALFELHTAQRLFDRGRAFDAIYVAPRAGETLDALIASLERTVGPQNLVLRSNEPAPWMNTRGPLIPLLALGAVMSLGLSALLVYNILALSLAERRRDIAVASAVGTSPRALVAGIVGESGLLGVLGGVLGVGIGIVLAHPLVKQFASVITEQALGLKVAVHIPPTAYVVGLLVGTSIGALSAIVPARRALKIDLAAELHGRAVADEEAGRSGVVRVGALLVAAAAMLVLSNLSRRGGGLDTWQPTVAALSLIAASVFVFASTGALAPYVLRWLSRGLRTRGGPFRISIANLVSRPRRSRVIATSLGAAVGLACVLGALTPAIRATVGSSDLGSLEGRVLVKTLPLNNAGNVDARPSRALLDAIARVPGVARVDLAYVQEVTDDAGVYAVGATEASDEASYVRVLGDVSPEALRRGDAIVGTSLARVRHLRPGSRLRVATPHGFVPVRVSGVWTNAQENGFNVTVSVATFKRFFPVPAPSLVLLTADSGVTGAELARRVEAAGLDPDLYALTPQEATARLADEVAAQGSAFWTLQRALLLVALVGTLSTLLLVGVQRRREIGVLGAVGFSPIALGGMTIGEGLAAGIAGSVLGILGSLAVFEVLRNTAAVSIGVRPNFSFHLPSAVSATLLGAFVVVLGAALPAWRAARVQIVEAIRDE